MRLCKAKPCSISKHDQRRNLCYRIFTYTVYICICIYVYIYMIIYVIYISHFFLGTLFKPQPYVLMFWGDLVPPPMCPVAASLRETLEAFCPRQGTDRSVPPVRRGADVICSRLWFLGGRILMVVCVFSVLMYVAHALHIGYPSCLAIFYLIG